MILRRTSAVLFAYSLLTLLLLIPVLHAQTPSAIRSVVWSPQPLRVGSPCMFTVKLSQPATAVKGTWFGHEIVFTPRHEQKGLGMPSRASMSKEPPESRTSLLEVGIAAGMSR